MSYADEVLAKIRADIEKPSPTKPKYTPKTYDPIVDLPGEQWKKVQDHDQYEISNMGRITSTSRGQRKLLKVFSVHRQNRVPYQKVSLCKNKKKSLHAIHNLVAQAFCNKPDTNEHTMVSHLDGDNTNNRADNLEWITRHESRPRAFTTYPRKNIIYWEGIPIGRHSLNMGGNRSMVSNRMHKNGWCLECACTIPAQTRGKQMQTCTHQKE